MLLLLSRFSCVRLCATPETAAHQDPRPWDSPGKNTGVGCYFFLPCMKVKSESEVAQSHRTLHDPMDCSLPGSSVHLPSLASLLTQARVLDCGPQQMILLEPTDLKQRKFFLGSCKSLVAGSTDIQDKVFPVKS